MAFIQNARHKYGHPISSSALLLEADIRIAFRAGAWLAVIALAAAAVEAQFRHVFTEDYESKASRLYGSDPELQWLREIRNEILHVSAPGTTSMLWKVASADLRSNHEALEPEARRAVTAMFRTVYGQNAP